MSMTYEVGPGLHLESDRPLSVAELDAAREALASGRDLEAVAARVGARVFTPPPYPDRRKGRLMVLRDPLLRLLEEHYPDEQARERVLKELLGG